MRLMEKRASSHQEGLLKLMGQVDPIYLERYNHPTVAKWESGATRPTKELLEAFGKALDLSVAQVQGMIRLAGFHDNAEEPDLAESPGRSFLNPRIQCGQGRPRYGSC